MTGPERRQQLVRRPIVKRLDERRRQAAQGGHPSATRLSLREHQPNPLAVQPPRHERQRLDGRRVDPLDVVHEAEEPALRGRGRQQAKRGQAEVKPVRGPIVVAAERRLDGMPLSGWQAGHRTQHRHEQLVKAGEVHTGLEGRPACPRQLQPVGRRGQVGEHQRLAGTAHATDQQRAAAPHADIGQQLVDQPALRPQLDQSDGHVCAAHTTRPDGATAPSGHSVRLTMW